MEKIITSCIAFIVVCSFHAQELISIDKKVGLLRATATISPSFGLATNPDNVYLSGEFEGFLNHKHSLRGDVFALVGSLEDNQIFKANHHLLFGPQWHKEKGKMDFFGGFQTGLSMTEIKNYSSLENNRLGFAPSFSCNIGTSLYVNDFFHFFVNMRYLNNKYARSNQGRMNLDELILSAGLGFHIFTRKVEPYKAGV